MQKLEIGEKYIGAIAKKNSIEARKILHESNIPTYDLTSDELLNKEEERLTSED